MTYMESDRVPFDTSTAFGRLLRDLSHAVRGEVLAGKSDLLESVEFIKSVADLREPVKTEYGHGSSLDICTFCGANNYNGPYGKKDEPIIPHDSSCIWRRAKEQVYPGVFQVPEP